MPHLTKPTGQAPPSGTLFVGIGIRRVLRATAPHPQHHVALIYSTAGGRCRLSQLEADYRFIDCLWELDGNYLWRGTPALDEVDMATTVAWLTDLNRSKPEIPYGFQSAGCKFTWDIATGGLRLSPDGPGVGLTCATFVCAVFNSLSLPLIDDEEGWPVDRPEDSMWRWHMLGALKYSTERVFAARSTPPDPRIKPEEVVAAFGQDPWPVDYVRVRAIAQQIVDEVAAAAEG
jgi:hypothetical protein